MEDRSRTAQHPEPSKVELLELDIDIRVSQLWKELATYQGVFDLDVVASFMRAAYGRGYCDALGEERVGSLCEDHGYTVPERGLVS